MTRHTDEFSEDGLNLAEPPPGSHWAYGWYCPGCGAELGEPGDPEPPTHCPDTPPAWEWMLAIDVPRDGGTTT